MRCVTIIYVNVPIRSIYRTCRERWEHSWHTDIHSELDTLPYLSSLLKLMDAVEHSDLTCAHPFTGRWFQRLSNINTVTVTVNWRPYNLRFDGLDWQLTDFYVRALELFRVWNISATRIRCFSEQDLSKIYHIQIIWNYWMMPDNSLELWTSFNL